MMKDEIIQKGMRVTVPIVDIRNKRILVQGGLLKTASLKNEWYEDIGDPDRVIRQLREHSGRVDLLTFWQRPPESEVRYRYYHEWVDVAGLPITTYENWWKSQINAKTRNMVRKSSKLGVTIDEVRLDDSLAGGVAQIFNESTVRRGKRFWHFGKSVEETKAELSDRLGQSIFIGAYFEEELIGFIKLVRTDRYAMMTLILDKLAHRNKSTTNGMIAKAVEACAQREIPLLTYTVWRRGSHGAFQKRNGFEHIPVPRYFVPLNVLGRLALQLGLHQGLKNALPDRTYTFLLSLRAKWYRVWSRIRWRQ